MITYDGGAATHVGAIRDVNQDRMILSGTIAAVADGMGGHAGGEKAAALAIGELSGVRGTITADRFHKVVEAANRRIYETSADPALRGMGTTIVAAAVDAEAEQLNIVNVGDSRAYRFRGGELEQLTIDHSLVEDLVREGRLSPEEALTHPQRNIVTRALGINPQIEIDMFIVDAVAGDRFILCSDGLFNEVDDDGIIEILERVKPSEEAAAELVEAAVRLGGRDNVTVVIVDILDSETLAEMQATASAAAETERTGPDTDVMDTPIEEAHAAPPPQAFGGFGSGAEAAADQAGLAAAEDAVAGDEAADGDDAPPPPAGTDELIAPAHAEGGPKKRRWLPFRTSIILMLSVVGVVGVGISSASWYARSTYYADEINGQVVIFKGRPGGVLWFEPVTVENTQLNVSTLDGASQELLNNRTQWRSLDEAREFVRNLELAPSGSGAADGG